MSRPVRTCTGCRLKGDKSDLIRVVVQGDELRVDERQVLEGRGAYLHRSENCLDRALKRRALGRALRRTVDVDRADAVLRPVVHRDA